MPDLYELDGVFDKHLHVCVVCSACVYYVYTFGSSFNLISLSAPSLFISLKIENCGKEDSHVLSVHEAK